MQVGKKKEGKGHIKATVTKTRKKNLQKIIENAYAIIQILGRLLKFGTEMNAH